MKQSFWFFGTHVSILADEHATHRLYNLIEGDFTSGSATRWHVHQAYAAGIYVVSGELTVHTKSQTTVLRTGQKAVVPPSVTHQVVGSSAGPGRALTAKAA
jgi:quercetin dioxygenase-like cupin family protein